MEQNTPENEEFSVFNEVKKPRPPKDGGKFQRFLYVVFASVFLVRAVSRWAYFIALRNYSRRDGLETINAHTLPYLISALSASVTLVASLVLYFMKNMRAAVALFILGALIELLIFYIWKPF